jgi:peptidoglycan/LPS O-acetylase OafA/YrhL
MSAPLSFTSRRDTALDGFRGLMTLLVLVSHYFAEIAGGFPRGAAGFIAVDGFFVLSGMMVGRLVLERGAAGNFMSVFYLRRVFRTFPIYFACLAVALAGEAAVGLPGNPHVPAWSYFAFVNNIFSGFTGDVGRPWLSPYWTMAVEEQFYLVAPTLLIFTPRRARLPVLGAIVAFAIACRAIFLWEGAPGTASTLLLVSRADCLAIGLACAVLLNGSVDWTRRLWLSVVAVLAALALGAEFGPPAMVLIGHTLICLALAVYLMAVAQGAQERRSLDIPLFRYCGDTSYAIYLTHMPVLWLAHAALRGASPTIANLPGLGTTLLCIPVTFALAHVLTRFIEAPITAVGRSFAWAPPRGTQAASLKPQAARP